MEAHRTYTFKCAADWNLPRPVEAGGHIYGNFDRGYVYSVPSVVFQDIPAHVIEKVQITGSLIPVTEKRYICEVCDIMTWLQKEYPHEFVDDPQNSKCEDHE